MRKLAIIAFLLLVAVTFNAKADNTTKGSYTEVVNGVEFEMKYVEVEGKIGKTEFENYHISATEVTQELWEAVMGTTVAMQRDKINPSMPLAGVGDKYPIYYVSQKEAKEFCKRLSQLTGKNYSLPHALQWEYAAIGGKQSRDYKYSGSNNVEDVAWIKCESTHPVATKMPNELGIYDMSGNVYEWCEGEGELRGGSWMCEASCAEYDKENIRNSSSRDKIVGFRVVENLYKIPYKLVRIEGDSKVINLSGITFKMIKVSGGTFKMGSSDSEAWDDEKPVHSVTLDDYYIGETEVTQELWEAVMGTNPSYFKGSNKPVEWVSWDDCQEFIKKLNRLTGINFRLPTEAEWECAARGGNKSRGYKYAGSNTIGDVAWYGDNAYYVGESSPAYGTHPVGTKSPNELGLYDMSGNVWEWCSDWYGEYSSSSQTNPTGPTSGSGRVYRGGSWLNYAQNCRVAYRDDAAPDIRYNPLGLRLVCTGL